MAEAVDGAVVRRGSWRGSSTQMARRSWRSFGRTRLEWGCWRYVSSYSGVTIAAWWEWADARV